MNILKKSSQRFSSFKNLISLIISFGCIYWSFANFNFNEFINYYQSIDYLFFIIAIIVLIFSVIIRSIRWSLFFKEEELYDISLFELFKNQMIGYFGNNIFPFKLGDLLRAFMMSKKNNLSKTYLLGTIALERILDIGSLFLLIILLSIFWGNIDNLIQVYTMYDISIISIIGYLIIFFFLLLGVYLIIKNSKYSKNWNIFLSPVKNIKGYKDILNIIILSLSVWIIYLFNIKIISYACGHNLSIEESLLLLTFTTLFMIIPAAPGMIGTFHASVIIVMTRLLEFSNQEASSFSIILHAYSYITYSIIGGFYFFKSNIRMND